MVEAKTCIVVGVGPGLGAAVARRFASAGHPVALAARTENKLGIYVEGIEAASLLYFGHRAREARDSW